ncbi:DNA-binding response regulator [Rhodococcus rhodnii]|uniref:Response regulator n=2 Tax=Rhodococcus rhodnii TaxID=38312 RepID=R7WLZ7_9NOCA|nr:response regulator transcription factor [Rhodococcus rhodnii]EOM76308.1 response regulator [Rhodococcus rhodnii LMG 5362]TXG89983.1 DNA-binding response regulator [Rhodococcus rhodnii]
MTTAGAVTVLLVDDQTLVRQGLRNLLALNDIGVLGEAADGREAADFLAGTERPDVVLLDLRMPGYDGLWLLDRLRERGDTVPVLVLTTFDDDELVLAALRSGARGYLLKDVTLDQLTGAVHTLAAGGTHIQPAVTHGLLQRVDRAPEPDDGTVVESLTDRERDVLRLVARGFGNREIARALFLAEGTVKNHVSAILVKLGARDRTSAVLRALRHGVL